MLLVSSTVLRLRTALRRAEPPLLRWLNSSSSSSDSDESISSRRAGLRDEERGGGEGIGDADAPRPRLVADADAEAEVEVELRRRRRGGGRERALEPLPLWLPPLLPDRRPRRPRGLGGRLWASALRERVLILGTRGQEQRPGPARGWDSWIQRRIWPLGSGLRAARLSAQADLAKSLTNARMGPSYSGQNNANSTSATLQPPA